MKKTFKKITAMAAMSLLVAAQVPAANIDVYKRQTYDSLEKYGYDLVKRAREQKLDPVSGRDSEIRNVVRILSRKTKNNTV